MKLPDALNQFLHKTPEPDVAYLSLVLQAGAVQAGVWAIPSDKKPRIGEAVSERVVTDAWDKRLEACDRAIAKIAEKTGRDDFEKVVLGIPAYYLTEHDDIEHDTRGRIKTLTTELELTPIGFVPIHQALIHQIKEEEGVPPSVIFLEIGPGNTTVIVYKVGAIVGREQIANDDIVPQLERTLKGFKELEVLPSRVLLYGSDEAAMETYKRDLLKHPWPTRANFLHYPKIEVLPSLAIARAVSLAGASELVGQIGEEKAETATPAIQTTQEEEVVEPEKTEETDENVVEVTPETLGFKRDVDLLEKPTVEEEDRETGREEEWEKEGKKVELKETLARFISGVKRVIPADVRVPKAGIVILVALSLLLIAGGWWLTYWALPKASITLIQLPQTIAESSSVTVDPTATVVDPTSKTVPGRKQEKTVSGDKTIAVTGQGDIGDPARGTVTIYNKTLTSKQLPKGTVLTAGSLSFTLDSDVSIASASESVGSITFGKADTAITAAKLGPQSNVPEGTEFSVKDTSTSIMVVRNDAALSGGTSKVVTVVSRADQNALVEALTKELIEKAKGELAAAVGGTERLIDETVQTRVTKRDFKEELEQEAKELHGTLTITISGVSYSEGDITSLFDDLVAVKVPEGYTRREGTVGVSASGVKVQKDGKLTMMIEYQGQALPTFDAAAIRTLLAGKTFARAQEDIRQISGVAGIEIGKPSWSLWGSSKFPANAKNIAVTMEVLE